MADFDRVRNRVVLDRPTYRAVAPGQRAGRLLRRGDLLLEKSGGGDLQPVGAVVLYDHDEPAVCSNFVARVVLAPGHDARFMTYLFRSLYDRRLNVRAINQSTGIQNLDAARYFGEQVAFPPLLEQRAIADYLDRKTAAINELVARKTRVLELIEEDRRALITRALDGEPGRGRWETGFRPVPSIPAGWRLVRVKFLATKIGSGKTPSGGATAYVSSGPMLVRSQNVRNAGPELDDVVFITQETDEEMAGTRLREGDVLLNITGASLGRCCAWPGVLGPANVNQHVCIVRPRREVLSGYLALALQGSRSQRQIFADQAGSSREGLNFDQVGNLRIPLPPRDEQRRVVDRLARRFEALGALTAATEASVAALREYRRSVVVHAVAGHPGPAAPAVG